MTGYILSVAAVGLFGAVFSQLSASRKNRELLRLLCGMFLILAIFRPIYRFRMPELADLTGSFRRDAEAAASQGQEASRQALEAGIAERTGAYILEQAAALTDNKLTVQVALTEDSPPIPRQVTVSGEISPEAREVLSQWMEENLGLSREQQLWIG